MVLRATGAVLTSRSVVLAVIALEFTPADLHPLHCWDGLAEGALSLGVLHVLPDVTRLLLNLA
jgi:hypothetical protein